MFGNGTMPQKRVRTTDGNKLRERAIASLGTSGQTKGYDMKKLIIAVVLAATAAPALAQNMTYYLVRQWFDRGNLFCQYQNGTVLNIGVGVCPLSIRG